MYGPVARAPSLQPPASLPKSSSSACNFGVRLNRLPQIRQTGIRVIRIWSLGERGGKECAARARPPAVLILQLHHSLSLSLSSRCRRLFAFPIHDSLPVPSSPASPLVSCSLACLTYWSIMGFRLHCPTPDHLQIIGRKAQVTEGPITSHQSTSWTFSRSFPSKQPPPQPTVRKNKTIGGATAVV